MNSNNLYYDSVASENFATPSTRDSSYVVQNNVVSGVLYRDPETRELLGGTMPINPDLEVLLNADEVYRIPKGYHTGFGIVRSYNLKEATQGTATADDIAFNKIAWVNGIRIVGKLSISKNNMIGTATENDILSNKTAWVNGKQLTGKIPIIMRTDYSLRAGESYVIEKGYHGGEAIISAMALELQTKATATEDDIRENRTAWVNGELIIGKLKSILELCAECTAVARDIRLGKTAYSAEQLIEGSMDEYLNQPIKKLLCGNSFTIPEGFHDGLWVVQAESLYNQTKATATENDIRKGKSAWVNGVLINGTMTQLSKEETEADATEYDIRENRTAWVNGEEVIGKNKYDSVSYVNRSTNKGNDKNPVVIILPDNDWESINSIDIFVISSEDQSYLYDFHYIDYKSDMVVIEKDSDVNVLSIVSSYGSQYITVTSYISNTYIDVYVNNYKLNY